MIGKKVRVICHCDEEGDHIPIGTVGVVVNFDDETADGIIIEFDGKRDLVFPEELEIINEES